MAAGTQLSARGRETGVVPAPRRSGRVAAASPARGSGPRQIILHGGAADTDLPAITRALAWAPKCNCRTCRIRRMDSLSVGIRVPSIDCDGKHWTQVNTDLRDDLLSRMPSSARRVAGIRSEWWPPSNRKAGRDQIVKLAAMNWNLQDASRAARSNRRPASWAGGTDGKSARKRPMPAVPRDSLSSALTRNIRTLEERRAREAVATTRQEKVVVAITSLHRQYAVRLLARGVLRSLGARGLGRVTQASRDLTFPLPAWRRTIEAIFTLDLRSDELEAAVAEAADKRADLDLHISLLTEHEVKSSPRWSRPWRRISNIATAEGAELSEIKKDVALETVLDEIEAERQKR